MSATIHQEHLPRSPPVHSSEIFLQNHSQNFLGCPPEISSESPPSIPPGDLQWILRNFRQDFFGYILQQISKTSPFMTFSRSTNRKSWKNFFTRCPWNSLGKFHRNLYWHFSRTFSSKFSKKCCGKSNRNTIRTQRILLMNSHELFLEVLKEVYRKYSGNSFRTSS